MGSRLTDEQKERLAEYRTAHTVGISLGKERVRGAQVRQGSRKRQKQWRTSHTEGTAIRRYSTQSKDY